MYIVLNMNTVKKKKKSIFSKAQTMRQTLQNIVHGQTSSPPSDLRGGAPASAHAPSWMCACCECTRPSSDSPDTHARRSAGQNARPTSTNTHAH